MYLFTCNSLHFVCWHPHLQLVCTSISTVLHSSTNWLPSVWLITIFSYITCTLVFILLSATHLQYKVHILWIYMIHTFDIVLLTSGMYHHICPPLFGEESPRLCKVKNCWWKNNLHSLHLEHLDPVGMEWIPEFFLVYILAAGSRHCVYLGQCKCEDWDWSLIADLSLTWMLTCEDWSTVGSRLLVLPLPLPQTYQNWYNLVIHFM